MKRNIHNIISALAAMLLLMLPATVNAADYVDEINNKTEGYAAGQRVIYELNVGSFTQAGTLNAAQAQLQNLKTLGVDIVWLMPIYPRDGGQNSPYAARDFKAVNPSYGTIDDLKAFVNAAHRLGMEVWLDWVPNHTATNNVWVTSHPEYYTKDTQGRMVHPASDGNYYSDGQTAQNGAIIYTDVYQLDYSNSALQDAMNECLEFWIDQANVDGYRCDMVSSKGIPASYWQKAIPLIKNYKAGKTISFLGEDDMSNASEFSKRSVGFDYDYAWNFQESNLQNGFGSGTSANTLRNYCTSFVNTSRNLGVGRLVYLTNHDQNWNGTKKTLTQKYGTNKYLLTVLTFTIYGMPLIYNGEEAGGDQALNYFQDTKINWNVDAKMTNTLRTLAALKHSQPALKDGKTASDNGAVTFLTTNQQNNILAYKRTSGTNEVLVVLNTSNSQQTVTIQNVNGDYSKWLDGATIASGTSRSNIKFNGSATITIPAKGYQVYVNQNASDEDNKGDDNVPVITNLTDDTPTSIFYESDVANASVHVWFWNGSRGGENYTANGTGWPGDAMTQIGKTADGRYIYKLALNVKSGLPLPSMLIITENGTTDDDKTVNNAAFVNHGYYVKGSNASVKVVPVSTTGINTLSINKNYTGDNKYYDLAGRQIPKPEHGFFIHNGKKYVL